MLQNIVKAVHDLKISKMTSSSSSSSGPALPIWPDYLAKHVEEAPPADAVMGDATTDSPPRSTTPTEPVSVSLTTTSMSTGRRRPFNTKFDHELNTEKYTKLQLADGISSGKSSPELVFSQGKRPTRGIFLARLGLSQNRANIGPHRTDQNQREHVESPVGPSLKVAATDAHSERVVW